MKTELIASWKLVNTKTSKGERQMYIITTDKGNKVWCTKDQFDTNAETITFTEMKKGDKYLNSKQEEAELQADRNEFQGCGRQIVKKFNTLEVMDHLASKGITPSFQLS